MAGNRNGQRARMDLGDFQYVLAAVAGIGMSLGIMWGWLRKGLPWIKRRWANRTNAVIRAGLDALQVQGAAATTERTALSRKLDAFGRELAHLGATMRAVVAADPTKAMFEAGPDGLLHDASRTLLTWTGRTQEELDRWGWFNAVADEQRQKVRGEWESAVRDVRAIVIDFELVSLSGTRTAVRATVTPIPEGIIPCDKFVVVLVRIE